MSKKSTVPIIFSSGSYGTYLEWCLTTLTTDVDVNSPLTANGNSHNFHGNHLFGIDGWRQYLASSTYHSFVRFHPKIYQTDDVYKNLNEISSAVDFFVYLYPSQHTLLLALNNQFTKMWKDWWKYIVVDQVFVWGPGCFMGMALPALISLEFSDTSTLVGSKLDWAQSLITADGISRDPRFGPAMANIMWIVTILVGMLVMLPSQMSIVDDFSRRWTDILWSGSRRLRNNPDGNAVKVVYYTILAFFLIWTVVFTYIFSNYGTPRLMTLVVANLNNLALGVTSFHLLWINCRLLPAEIQPRWYHRAGVLACGVFYLGMSGLVFMTKQWPMLKELLGW